MSNTETLLTYDEGMKYYQEVEDLLVMVCQKVEVAGSLRRENTTVHDVEVVCIPKESVDLLGSIYYTSADIRKVIARIRHEHAIIKGGEKFIQLLLVKESIKTDIFITTPNQYGVIKAIRTGSASFSKWLVTPRKYGGAMPGNMRVKDGWLMRGSEKIPTPSERILFEEMKIKYIEPNKRNFPPQEPMKLYLG